MRGITMAALLVAAPAAAQTVQPGQWSMTSTVVDAKMPDMPPMVVAMLKKPHTVGICITPEQAKAGPRELLKSAPGCTFNRFEFAGGRYATEMVCARGGMTTTSSGSGTYTPVSMAGTSHIVGTGAQSMEMTASVSGKRVGDCR